MKLSFLLIVCSLISISCSKGNKKPSDETLADKTSSQSISQASEKPSDETSVDTSQLVEKSNNNNQETVSLDETLFECECNIFYQTPITDPSGIQFPNFYSINISSKQLEELKASTQKESEDCSSKNLVIRKVDVASCMPIQQ